MVYDLEPHPISHSQPSASNITGNIFPQTSLQCKKVGITLRQSLTFAYREPARDSSWDLQIGSGQHLFFTISTSDSYCSGTGL